MKLEPDSPIWHALKRGLATFGVKPPATISVMDSNPILFRDRLAAGEPPDAECLEWLRISFKRIQRGDGPADVCLGLTGGNRMTARNKALIRAARLLDGEQRISAWQLAELLRQAVVRFRDVTLERIQRGDAGELTPVQAALAAAFASGAKPLTSRDHLYRVLSNCQ